MPHPVPIGEYEPTVPVEEGLRRVIPFQTPSHVGTALEGIGGQLERINQQAAQRDAAAYHGTTAASLRVAAEQHLLNNLQKPQEELDKNGGLLPSVMKDFQANADAALKGAPNALAARAIRQSIANIGAELSVRALHQQARAQITQRDQGLADAGDQVASAVELNPGSWKEAAAEQHTAIQHAGLDLETTLKRSHETDEKILTAAGRGFAKSDPEGTLKRINDQNDDLFSHLPLHVREAVETYAKGQYVEKHALAIQGVYESQGTSAGARALAGIDKDKSIPEELRDPIRAQVNRQVNEWRDQRREQFAQTIAGLETKIAKGEAGPAEMATAQNLFEKGAFNATQLASAAGGIARSEKKQADDSVSLEAVSQAYANGVPLDPKDKDVRDDVGLLFSALTRNVQQGSDEYANRAADIAKKTGVTPDPAITWARTQLNGGNGPTVAQAADLVMRLEEANPRSLAFADDPKTKAMAVGINAAVRAGTDPTMAVEIARKNAENTDNKMLDEQWKTQRIPAGQANALRARLKTDELYKPGIFTGLPDVPPAMQSEYDELTQQYYKYTGGDINQARDAAVSDLKHVWGVSEVNGKRELMPYAPERMFPGLTPEVIRADIKDSVGDQADPKKVRLVMDPERTARTAGAQWNLAAPNEHGLIDILRDERGRPLVYQLPVTKGDYAATKERLNAEAMSRARTLQTARHQEAMADQDFRESGEGSSGLMER
jgi:hypothetical protein